MANSVRSEASLTAPVLALLGIYSVQGSRVRDLYENIEGFQYLKSAVIVCKLKALVEARADSKVFNE